MCGMLVFQGPAIHVHVQVQDVVDDTEDGLVGPRHPRRDAILDRRGRRRRRRRAIRGVHRLPPDPGGLIPSCTPGERK